MSKIALSPEEIKLLVEVLEGLVGYLISKTDITPEDKAKLLAIQERLSVLKTKEQRIADGL